MARNKNKGLQFYKRKKKINKTIVNEVFIWILGIAIAIFLAGVSNYFFGTTTRMIGVSMEPTLCNEQKVMIDKFCYVLGTPKIGDVVAFLPNGNENSHYYVKRVIAVPGDRIMAEDGILYVNGIESPYLTDKLEDMGIAAAGLTLSAGQYFCIGDDPNNSEDSRSANIGPVLQEYILGRVWFRQTGESKKLGFVTRKIDFD